MERPTKVLETPVDKHKIEIKSWVSGGENEQIQEVWLMDMEMQVGEEVKPKIKGSQLTKANHKLIELLVVKFDDSVDGILEKILDMKNEDYQFLVSELNEITNPTEKKIDKKD